MILKREGQLGKYRQRNKSKIWKDKCREGRMKKCKSSNDGRKEENQERYEENKGLVKRG